MTLDSQSWHARLYRWWYKHKFGSRDYAPEPDFANLCPYVRTVLFWAPLRALFLTKVAWASWPLLVLLLHLLAHHMWGHKWIVMELAFLGLVAFWAGVFSICYLCSLATKSAQASESLRSFGQVLHLRYRSLHERICPILQIQYPEVKK